MSGAQNSRNSSAPPQFIDKIMILSRVATKLTKGLAKRAYTSTAASYDLKVADKPKAANIHHFKIYRWDPDQDQDVSWLLWLL